MKTKALPNPFPLDAQDYGWCCEDAAIVLKHAQTLTQLLETGDKKLDKAISSAIYHLCMRARLLIGNVLEGLSPDQEENK